MDVNQTARLFYIGKEFVLLLRFDNFKIPVHAFLLILGLSASVTDTFMAEKNKLASKILSGNSGSGTRGLMKLG